MENNEKSFEELIEELNKIVSHLESRDINLSDAVNEYTKGVSISKKCYDILEKNKEIVTKIMTEKGLDDFKEEK